MSKNSIANPSSAEDADQRAVSLVRAIRAGDNVGLAILLEHYFHPLAAIVRKWFGSSSRAVVDEQDVASQALVSFCRSVQRSTRADDMAHHELWNMLVGCARRTFLTERRRA